MVLTVACAEGSGDEAPVSVNLATEFARCNYRTIVFDCDPVPKDPDGQLRHTMSDYLSGNAELDDVIVEDPSGVKFVSGGGVSEKHLGDDDTKGQIRRCVSRLKPLCDYVILNTGPGVSSDVTEFVTTSDHTIVVTTTDFSSVANAYGIIKACARAGHGESVLVLVNQASSAEEAEQAIAKLKDCAKRFLGLELNCLDWRPKHTDVEAAMEQRSPSRETSRGGANSRCLKSVVSSLERLSAANTMSRPV